MVAHCGSWMRFSHDFPVEDIRLENPDNTHDTNANYREAITALQGCITTMFPDRMDILKLALCKKDDESHRGLNMPNNYIWSWICHLERNTYVVH